MCNYNNRQLSVCNGVDEVNCNNVYILVVQIVEQRDFGDMVVFLFVINCVE